MNEEIDITKIDF